MQTVLSRCHEFGAAFLNAKDHSKMLRVAQAGIAGFMENLPKVSVVQADIRATKQRMLDMKVGIVG